MASLKPRDIRNYLLDQNIPFDSIAKIFILRTLEELQVIPHTTLLDICNEVSSEDISFFFDEFMEKVDNFLLNHCYLPSYIIDELQPPENNTIYKVDFRSFELFLKTIASADYSHYFVDHDDDFLGKLNETHMGEKKGVVYTPKTIIEHMSHQ